MTSSFQKAINIIREKANNDTEVGKGFESLTKVFLENDPTQTQQYSKVWFYEDWAKDKSNYSSKDIGIDLIAKIRDEESYCAIQCKCYKPDHSISKSDLDSFISASSTSDFSRLLLIDTSMQPIGKNAQAVFDNIDKDYLRIQTTELEESRIEWVSFLNDGIINLQPKKELRDHQIKALKAVEEGFKESNRGKMIMACGTGKTFTSLKIAESLAGRGKTVLYMVPSLALMSQTIREWKNDAKEDFIAFSACSDSKVGKRKLADDQIELSLNDLAFPATTNAEKLSMQVKFAEKSKMTVIFSTYQSINVITESQKIFGLQDFDLIICDEAHRTTGATISGEDESNFVKIHDDKYIAGKKRLYMTATPKIFGENAKIKADKGEVSLASMDDEKTFGNTFFYRGFGWAVENNLLTDYKVIVLVMDEQQVSNNIQNIFSEGSELKLDDATKMIGCYKALAKIGLQYSNKEYKEDIIPMKRALAFCQNIKSSEIFSSEFSKVVKEYNSNIAVDEKNKSNMEVELFHVDGTFNAEQRNEKLNWLKEETKEDICRVISNAKCLSEGVDVPALDAIMFLHPRKSQVDVVQSVGRVMRKSEGKKIGYVILPVTVAPGVTAVKSLNDNKRYQVVWQILNALRAHDERFDSTINKIGLGEDVSDRIDIIDGNSYSELEATTTVTDNIRKKRKKSEDSGNGSKIGGGEEGTNGGNSEDPPQQLSFTLTELSQGIKAKIVEKCGTRDYWENWATDIAKIAQSHITRIKSIVFDKNKSESIEFFKFLEEIRDDLNPEITESDAVEMLAQHIVTKPVFDALFSNSEFTSQNHISKALESLLQKIYNYNIQNESKTLVRFYKSVKRRSEGIITSQGKQKLILELYDRFFRNAFPLLTEKLGIVYTPIEIVDFIINSTEEILKEEFKTSLSNNNVHILDPFAGTGTFISRILQSKIINKENLAQKYKYELHSNEIILLACYIASINIESVYAEVSGEEKYEPFNGMVLTDTFQLYEQEKDLIANLLPDNSQKRTKQKEKKIKVIIGNPPYSAQQKSANDNAANVKYSNLDERILQTYLSESKATLNNALYDSYIRAFRWATDRIEDEGVIAYVTNAGWIENLSTSGFRRSLEEEFSKIYIFHLRGNQRTKGERSRKEGGKIFGSGSRSPIAISILVKKKNFKEKGEIFLCDIGDYLSREEKLTKIKNIKSIGGIKKLNLFTKINPDIEHDWINQTDKSFSKHTLIGGKLSKDNESLFSKYSLGVSTNCDSWLYNSSKQKLRNNINKLVNFYNSEVDRYQNYGGNISIEKFVDTNQRKISWHRSLFQKASKGIKTELNENDFRIGLYRPFQKQLIYFNKHFASSPSQNPLIFPDSSYQNKVIVVSGIGADEFSCLSTDLIPNLHFLSSGQCFPLHYQEIINDEPSLSSVNLNLFSEKNNKLSGLDLNTKEKIKVQYEKYDISDKEIFYYVYAVLHSEEYRNKYKNNLSKELPRIPFVKSFSKFLELSNKGESLMDMHINFENIEKYPISFKEGHLELLPINNPIEFFRVEKMKFSNKNDKSEVFFNRNLTMVNIPVEAYQYKLNGKSALELIMERQVVSTDSKTGICNDANDFANEIMGNPRYPLELFQKIITLSLKTQEIIKDLPDLELS